MESDTRRPSRHRPTGTRRRHQHGLATLVIVMLLFFVLSLTAAYTARNLIFEQRTATNLYRSTQQFDAAEAGLEWATALLNGGLINDNCTPTTDTTKDNFRQRYLDVNAATGAVTRRLRGTAAANLTTSYRWAACIFDGTDWKCDCPTNSLPTQPTVDTLGNTPAFAVRFSNQTARPGLTRIEVNGCNSWDTACLFAFAGVGGADPTALCRSAMCAVVALHSGMRVPPVAAITARGAVTVTALNVTNLDALVGGWTIRSGGAIIDPANALVIRTLPGTPGTASLWATDPALLTLNPDTPGNCTPGPCLFSSVFGLRPVSYTTQPAVLEIDCAAAACSAATVNAARAAHPGRLLWLRGAGGLAMDSAGTAIGSNAEPVVMAIDGPMDITAAALIHGLVYAGSASLSSGEVRGALVSASTVTASGSATVTYDGDILGRLQRTTGSFVRLPGGWRDLP